jgi:ribosomal protein L37AE/L43A
MAKCPECGGNMKSRSKRKICETCGLSLSGGEYDRMWDKINDQKFRDERQARNKHRDYLKWYESHK